MLNGLFKRYWRTIGVFAAWLLLSAFFFGVLKEEPDAVKSVAFLILLVMGIGYMHQTRHIKDVCTVMTTAKVIGNIKSLMDTKQEQTSDLSIPTYQPRTGQGGGRQPGTEPAALPGTLSFPRGGIGSPERRCICS